MLKRLCFLLFCWLFAGSAFAVHCNCGQANRFCGDGFVCLPIQEYPGLCTIPWRQPFPSERQPIVLGMHIESLAGLIQVQGIDGLCVPEAVAVDLFLGLISPRDISAALN